MQCYKLHPNIARIPLLASFPVVCLTLRRLYCLTNTTTKLRAKSKKLLSTDMRSLPQFQDEACCIVIR